jgi:hypothetical protein
MSYIDWIVSELRDTKMNQDILSAERLSEELIEVRTSKGKIVVVGVIEGATINVSDIEQVCVVAIKKPDILVSKAASIWNGSAIDYVRQKNIGWGGMGEIPHAFHTTDYKSIQKREYQFVEDGLLRHTRVTRLERVFDRVFKIFRTRGLRPLITVLINSYELSAEEVRNATNKYGKFDIILKTNPNGSPTTNAYLAAKEVDADIFLWSELLSRLNRK